MPKKPSPNRIKRHQIYTVWEAAETLRLHRQTVIRWIKDHELDADRTRRPWLIAGEHLKAFLEARRGESRTRLATGEIYCLPCRRPQLPAERMADFRMKSATTGILSGLCPACERLMHRIIRRADLEPMRAILDVTVRQAVAGIVGGEAPCVTVTSSKARRHHG